jgi:hypothetical protein
MPENEYDSVAVRDLVNRRLYTDEALFRMEMDSIFRNAWLYMGNESQVRKPGDFFAALPASVLQSNMTMI